MRDNVTEKRTAVTENTSLVDLCRLLREEPSAEEDGRQPDAAPPDWHALAKLADRHYLTPLLYHHVYRHGLLPALPPDLLTLLTEIHRQSTLRNQRILEELDRLTALWNSAGVAPVLLKGAAALVVGLYLEPGLRVMNDVDLLAAPDEIEACRAVMAEAGYRPMDLLRMRPWHIHEMPLVHDGHNIRFELHRRPTKGGVLTAKAVRSAARRVQIAGGVALVPSVEHFALYNILHHQIQHKGLWSGQVWLYQLYDLYLITQGRAGTVDWAWLEARCSGGARRLAYHHAFHLLHRYFGQLPPGGRLAPLAGLQWRRRLWRSWQPTRKKLRDLSRSGAHWWRGR